MFNVQKAQEVKVTVISYVKQHKSEHSNLVISKHIKYVLSCKIANTFHIVVQSSNKHEPESELSVIVTEKNQSNSNGEPCLYGLELETFKAIEKENKRNGNNSDTESLISEAESGFSSQSQTPRKRARFSLPEEGA